MVISELSPIREKTGLTGFVIGDTLIQNAAIVLELNQGELKEDPVLGANLIRYIRSQADKRAIEKQMKIHLKRAGIDYSELVDKINIEITND